MVESNLMGKLMDLFRQNWGKLASALLGAGPTKWLWGRYKRWNAMKPKILIASATPPTGTILEAEWWGATLDLTNQLGRSVDCLHADLDFQHETSRQLPTIKALIIPHEGWDLCRNLTLTTMTRLEIGGSASIVLAAWTDIEKPQVPTVWPPDNRYRLKPGKWKCRVWVKTEDSSAKQSFEGVFALGHPVGFKKRESALRRFLFG